MPQFNAHDMRDRCARFVQSLEGYLHGDEWVWPNLIAHVIRQLPCEWMQPEHEEIEFKQLRRKVAAMDYRDLPDEAAANG